MEVVECGMVLYVVLSYFFLSSYFFENTSRYLVWSMRLLACLSFFSLVALGDFLANLGPASYFFFSSGKWELPFFVILISRQSNA